MGGKKRKGKREKLERIASVRGVKECRSLRQKEVRESEKRKIESE